MKQRAFRVMLITDGRGDSGRIREVVTAALRGGVTAVQVRERDLGARQLGSLCEQLLPAVHRVDGVLLVNDRVDVAAAGSADGVHLGQRSLAPQQARRIAPTAIIGVSTHDSAELAAAEAGGADYVSLSPVFATASKPEQSPLGVTAADALRRQSRLPALWLGGIDACRAAEIAPLRPFGIAVMSAVFGAADPEAAAAELCAALAATEGCR